MKYETKEELSLALEEQYDGVASNILLLQSTPFVLNCGVYDFDDTLVETFIALYREGSGWEIIKGEHSSLSAQIYFAYISSMFNFLEEVTDADDLFSNDLFS